MSRYRFLLTVMTVLLILSFTVTLAAADTPPSVEPGTTDEDGDLVVDVVTSVTLNGETSLPDMRDIPIPQALVSAEGAIMTDAAPISPTPFGYVYTNLPWFYFSPDSGAIKYQIAVYDVVADPDILVYTYNGMDACTGGVCSLRPTTALNYLNITHQAGVYTWAVRSKVGTKWTGWSSPSIFTVLKNGFNSDFATIDKKWTSLYGTWTFTGTGYLKTPGELGYVSSVDEKHNVVNGYVYEVKMKRKGYDMANTIYFNADPYPLDSLKAWNDGYLFQYKNDGYWSLYKYNEGVAVPIFDWTYSAHIQPNDWNTLTIMRGATAIKLWINGHWLNNTTDTTYDDGYVGIGMFKGSVDKSPLSVDYAKLYYTTTNPYPTGIAGEGEIEP